MKDISAINRYRLNAFLISVSPTTFQFQILYHFLFRYTCVYLACKVDEFYVPITQFVENLQGEKERTADVLLAQELLLMQQLHYHLTVYSCYRPLEGLLIDIKVGDGLTCQHTWTCC